MGMSINRKRNKWLSCAIAALVLLTAAFTLPLATGTAEEAYAAEPAEPLGPATRAAITKQLRMPVKTATPEHKYIFNITNIKEPDTTSAPAISPVAISFTKDSAVVTSDGSIKTVWEEASIDLGNVPWKDIGEYTYKITEKSTCSAILKDDDSVKEDLDFSKAVYTMTVFVARDFFDIDKDDDKDELYVKFITGKRMKIDSGEDNSGKNNPNEKVDLSPGDGENPGTFSKMAFTNKYVKTLKGTGAGNISTGALFIEETVIGEFGAHNYGFPVSVTITTPTLASVTTASAYVVEGGVVVTKPAIVYDNDDYTYTFTSGAAKGIGLKAGQRLVFVNLPVGTTYYAAQEATGGYLVNLVVKSNGDKIKETSRGVDEKGLGLSIADYSGVVPIVGEGGENSLRFSSAYEMVTPTGVIINNLPYILLIALVFGSLAAYILVRTRRRRKNYLV
jgi:hypothetical protein